jgi:hypothetical protein
MPRPRKSAAAAAAVKAEPQEARGGNSYLQQFTDIRVKELARLSSLKTKAALPRLLEDIKPLWAEASAIVYNAKVGQRKLRSNDSTHLQRVHGENVKNHLAKLLDKACKNPEQQRTDFTEALILLKQLQLYDSCMQQEECMPDWLRAIKKRSTAKRHSAGDDLPFVVVISDDDEKEIFDADSAGISANTDGLVHLQKRVKLEPVEHCDDAAQRITSDINAETVCDNKITSALNIKSLQLDTADTAMEVSTDTAATDTAAVKHVQFELLQSPVAKQPEDTSNSDTTDTTHMAVIGGNCCDVESTASEAVTDRPTKACTTDITTTNDSAVDETSIPALVKLEPAESCIAAASTSSTSKASSSSHDTVGSTDLMQTSQAITSNTYTETECADLSTTHHSTNNIVITDKSALNIKSLQIETGVTATDMSANTAATDNLAVDYVQYESSRSLLVAKPTADTSNSDTAHVAVVDDNSRCCDIESTASEALYEMSTEATENNTATDVAAVDAVPALESALAVNQQVTACSEDVVNAVLRDTNSSNCQSVSVNALIPLATHDSAADIISTNDATEVMASNVSADSAVSLELQSMTSDTTVAEVSTISNAAKLCCTTKTTGAQQSVDGCAAATNDMILNSADLMASSHSDISSTSNTTQVSSTALYLDTVVANSTSADITVVADHISTLYDTTINNYNTGMTDKLDTTQPSAVTEADSSSVMVNDANTSTEQPDCSNSSTKSLMAQLSCQTVTTADGAANDTVAPHTAAYDTYQPSSTDDSYDDDSSELAVQNDSTYNNDCSMMDMDSSCLQYDVDTGSSSDATAANMVSTYDTWSD